MLNSFFPVAGLVLQATVRTRASRRVDRLRMAEPPQTCGATPVPQPRPPVRKGGRAPRPPHGVGTALVAVRELRYTKFRASTRRVAASESEAHLIRTDSHQRSGRTPTAAERRAAADIPSAARDGD